MKVLLLNHHHNCYLNLKPLKSAHSSNNLYYESHGKSGTVFRWQETSLVWSELDSISCILLMAESFNHTQSGIIAYKKYCNALVVTTSNGTIMAVNNVQNNHDWTGRSFLPCDCQVRSSDSTLRFIKSRGKFCSSFQQLFLDFKNAIILSVSDKITKKFYLNVWLIYLLK